jgi:hypothetical protein
MGATSAAQQKARSRCARWRAFVILKGVYCLFRRTGQSRQHAMRMMMVMPEMVQLNAH